jgi:hypothetical protein
LSNGAGIYISLESWRGPACSSGFFSCRAVRVLLDCRWVRQSEEQQRTSRGRSYLLPVDLLLLVIVLFPLDARWMQDVFAASFHRTSPETYLLDKSCCLHRTGHRKAPKIWSRACLDCAVATGGLPGSTWRWLRVSCQEPYREYKHAVIPASSNGARMHQCTPVTFAVCHICLIAHFRERTADWLRLTWCLAVSYHFRCCSMVGGSLDDNHSLNLFS